MPILIPNPRILCATKILCAAMSFMLMLGLSVSCASNSANDTTITTDDLPTNPTDDPTHGNGSPTDASSVSSVRGTENTVSAANTPLPNKPSEPSKPSDLLVISPDDAIHIRSLNALSGDNAHLGIGNQRGIELALEDYGDLRGFRVSIGTPLDGLCSSDGGQAAAQTIVADKRVLGVIGPSCSITATASANLITAAGMVMIAPSNTSSSLTSDLQGNRGENHSEGYFRTAHNDLYQGKAIADFLHSVKRFRMVAAIHDGDPYSHGLVTSFADAFQALGDDATVIISQVDRESTDMVPVLTELAAHAPEALFFPVFRPTGDHIAEQVHNIPGMESTLMITAPSLGGDFRRLQQSVGMFFSGPDTRTSSNKNEATQMTHESVKNRYVDRYGVEPESPYWAHAYDATTLLLDTISIVANMKDDGSLEIDRQKLRQALHNTKNYQGLIGSLSCDMFGDCGTQQLVIFEHLDTNNPELLEENIKFEFIPN